MSDAASLRKGRSSGAGRLWVRFYPIPMTIFAQIELGS